MQELDGIIKSLAKEDDGSTEADFFYLVRLLENQMKELPRIGTAQHPNAEALRFGQMPFLKHTDSDIHSVTQKSAEGRYGIYEVLVYFFGLLGPNGPMPLELTDFIYHQNINDYDATTRRFLDIINHRFLSLYYRAFSMCEMPVCFDREDPTLMNFFRSFNRQGYKKITSLPEYAQFAFTAEFLHGRRSALGLENILKSYFGIHINIREFVEKTHFIPKEVRMHLGNRDTSVLGLNAQIGSRYTTRTQDIIVEIGPINYKESLDYMPGTPNFRQMYEIISSYLNRPLTVHTELKIDAGTVRELYLDGTKALGHGTHLNSSQGKGITTVSINMTSIMMHRFFKKVPY